MEVEATVDQCWCGAKRPYFEPLPAGKTCGGLGMIICECGGDLCVCHNHGEIECDGCEDCADGPDDFQPFARPREPFTGIRF